MSIEIQMLIGSTILALIQPFPYLFAYLKFWGLKIAASNRDQVPGLPLWAQRAQRAHANMVENFSHFAVLILLVSHLNLANEYTAFGATLFFWARLLYWPIYIAGIPWIRTIVFIIGLTAELIIAWQLIA
jgi:uncharacterized MAPEG superfamily protein